MKKQILDSPFLEASKYAFEDILQKDEKILWSGQPTAKKLFSIFDISMFGLIIFFLYPLQFAPSEFVEFVGGGIIFYLIYFAIKTYKIITMRNVRYAITPTRMLWSFKDSSPRNSHSIDFKNIKWAEMEDNAIFIRPKDYDLVTFQTQNPNDYSIRDKPTLENIENMSEVYDLIEKCIDENNSK